MPEDNSTVLKVKGEWPPSEYWKPVSPQSNITTCLDCAYKEKQMDRIEEIKKELEDVWARIKSDYCSLSDWIERLEKSKPHDPTPDKMLQIQETPNTIMNLLVDGGLIKKNDPIV